jgi:hypothetical protein
MYDTLIHFFVERIKYIKIYFKKYINKALFGIFLLD